MQASYMSMNHIMNFENGVIAKIYKSQVDPILFGGRLRRTKAKMGISSGPMTYLQSKTESMTYLQSKTESMTYLQSKTESMTYLQSKTESYRWLNINLILVKVKAKVFPS